MRACFLLSKWPRVKNMFVIVPSTFALRQHRQLKGRFYVRGAGSVAMCGRVRLAALLSRIPSLITGT